MKVCVVTGVTREQGLGYAIARRMVAGGYYTFIGGRNVESAISLARKIDPDGVIIEGSYLDISDETSVGAFVGRIMAKFDAVDALINNAGAMFDSGRQPLSAPFAEAEEAFRINLFGSWRMIRELYPLLKRNRAGRIVNVSSGAGAFSDVQYGLRNHPASVPAYGLSKLALNGLTVKLSREMEPDGVLINAVDPGVVNTYPGAWRADTVTPAEAAEGVVWAADLPAGGPTGKFFRNKREIGW